MAAIRMMLLNLVNDVKACLYPNAEEKKNLVQIIHIVT